MSQPTLLESLRQRRRNTFGKAFPLVGYDELQALLAEVDALRESEAEWQRRRDRSIRAERVAIDAIKLAEKVYGWAVHEPNTRRLREEIETLDRRLADA